MPNLWVAASDGDLPLVKQYIESGKFSANSKDPNGYTPIHAAALYNHIELLRYLIQSGGDINIKDGDGDTPLHHCDELAAIKTLISEFGADWHIRNNDGETAFEAYEGEDSPQVQAYYQSLSGTTGEATLGQLLAELPEADREKVKLSMKDASSLTGDVAFGEEQKKKIETILAGENAEENLQNFILQTISQNLEQLGDGRDGGKRARTE